MAKSILLPPKKDKKLFENLFQNLSLDQILVRISEGLLAVQSNSARLIKDTEILCRAERYGSGRFLLATANEEMAKIFILLDMCRLDFERHQSTLQKLCSAFYDHVTKSAYIKIKKHRQFFDMESVERIWEAETKKYWPSDPESGEPDFPHDTYFDREIPLYVDFIEYDQKWHTPDCGSQKFIFDDQGCFPSVLNEAKNLYKQIETSSNLGLFSHISLGVLNKHFRNKYISTKTKTVDIDNIYKKVAASLDKENLLKKEEFFTLCLHQWPLYFFAAQS